MLKKHFVLVITHRSCSSVAAQNEKGAVGEAAPLLVPVERTGGPAQKRAGPHMKTAMSLRAHEGRGPEALLYDPARSPEGGKRQNVNQAEAECS